MLGGFDVVRHLMFVLRTEESVRLHGRGLHDATWKWRFLYASVLRCPCRQAMQPRSEQWKRARAVPSARRKRCQEGSRQHHVAGGDDSAKARFPRQLRHVSGADGLASRVADVDRACLEQRPQHLQKTVPEGNRQRTAAALFTDAALIGAAWPFNLTTDIGPELSRAVHVWQVNNPENPEC